MTARRIAALATTCVLALVVSPRVVHADAKADVQAKAKAAMDSYDTMDYDAAKKLLGQAIALAKKSRLDKDPVLARVYVDVGIVAFAVPDQEAAKTAFQSAVQIDPKVQIEAAYRSADIAKLLDEARSSVSTGSPGPSTGDATPPSGDCGSVTGLQHTLIDNGKAGAAVPVEAMLGSDIQAAKVSLWYRGEGATDFTEVKMARSGCKFTAAIPAAGTHGSVVHYYVAAYDAANKVLAGKGSASSPNIIELAAGGGGGTKGDDEDPLGGGHKDSKAADSGGEVSAQAPSSPSATHVYATALAGTGLGYVTGKTEGGNVVKNCCLGNSLIVVTPEIGAMLGKQLGIGVAARLGFPVDANILGHSTLAPAGLVRVRYALDDSGEGVKVMGQAGFGVIRNTIKLDNPMQGGGDTDIVAQGPLLLGGGVGYVKRLSGSIAFVFDLSALIGVAVTKSLGSSTPVLNSGFTADLSVGLAVGI
jgi:hypothetical protein